MRASLLLLGAALGCAPGLAKSDGGIFIRSEEGVSLPVQEIWALTWKRLLPEIQATRRPPVPEEYADPALADAFRKGAESGRAWAIAEGIHPSDVCSFPKTPEQKARAAGFDAGRKSITAWLKRVTDETPLALALLGRPHDLALSGAVPAIVCFGRDSERLFSAAEREGRRAAVVVVYAQDYAALARRTDVVDALVRKALEPATRSAWFRVTGADAREAMKDFELHGDWSRRLDPEPGESEDRYLARVFAALP